MVATTSKPILSNCSLTSGDLAAPKGLPPAIKAKLETDLIAAAKSPEVKEQFEKIGFDVVATTGAQFDAFLAGEIARWKQVIETGKITVE